ncbi:hypothetical protein CVT26_009521 [Gymnopilus dilepis]|uniref:Uncharacterized protein n=1 Tax=Gymnopilus dilepis TaxID=231916 RepID=A0A409VJZ9_9AGAR|nr:hypothetical protein CVT26_009521 [Gymnopilus dilepis]
MQSNDVVIRNLPPSHPTSPEGSLHPLPSSSAPPLRMASTQRANKRANNTSTTTPKSRTKKTQTTPTPKNTNDNNIKKPQQQQNEIVIVLDQRGPKGNKVYTELLKLHDG